MMVGFRVVGGLGLRSHTLQVYSDFALEQF